MSASTHSVEYMVFSLVGFVSLYTIFFIVEAFLMVRAVRQGPDEHGDHGGHGGHATESPARERKAGLVPGEFAHATAAALSLSKEH
jgi:cytochrome d ubiquinol oxidase subunit I